MEDSEQKILTLNIELVQDFSLAAERVRVLATPTALDIVRALIICEKQPSKTEMLHAFLFDDRSIRRTMRSMARLGLLRWQPWNRSGEVSLTRTTKRILRAGGCNA